MDYEMERILIAFTDALFDDVDDDCAKKIEAYQLLENIRHDNNQEIMRQLGDLKKNPCNPRCKRKEEHH